MTNEAKHFDTDKVPLDSLPFEALCSVGKVIQFGEKKYGRNNWTKGMPWNKLLGSTLRHIFSWALGENLDPESRQNHLAHAITDLLFLLTYQLENLGEDNRRCVSASNKGDECHFQSVAIANTAPSEAKPLS